MSPELWREVPMTNLLQSRISSKDKTQRRYCRAATVYNYFSVPNFRPDQCADRVYGDPHLDWVILITNNIQNIHEDCPWMIILLENTY